MRQILRYWLIFRLFKLCRKKLVDPLIEECTENIDETKLVKKNFRR